MKYVAVVSLLIILIAYGYPIGAYLIKDKKHNPWMVLLLTAPIWLTFLAAIIVGLMGG